MVNTAQVYTRNMSRMWSRMHYILRTARCLHAWRSDTVTKIRFPPQKIFGSCTNNTMGSPKLEEDWLLRGRLDSLQEKLDERNRALSAKVNAVNNGEQALNEKVQEINSIVENLEKILERGRQQDSARRGALALAQRTEDLVSAQVCFVIFQFH